MGRTIFIVAVIAILSTLLLMPEPCTAETIRVRHEVEVGEEFYIDIIQIVNTTDYKYQTNYAWIKVSDDGIIQGEPPSKGIFYVNVTTATNLYIIEISVMNISGENNPSITNATNNEDDSPKNIGTLVAIVSGTMLLVAFIIIAGKKIFFSICYSLIDPEKILDHKTRRGIYDLIEKEPGITYLRIKTRLKLSTATTTYHIAMLAKAEKVIFYKAGLEKRFFPDNYRPSLNEKLTENEMVVYNIILNYNDITRNKIMKISGMKKSTLRKVLNRLTQKELITSNIVKRKNYYRLL